MLKLRGLITVALCAAAPSLASSVLVVCADDASRNLKDDITELLSSAKMTVKAAGPKAPATACLSQPAASRQACFATAGGAANVETLLLVSTKSQGANLVVTFEVLSAVDGKSVKKEVLRTAAPRFHQNAGPILRRVMGPGAKKSPTTNANAPAAASAVSDSGKKPPKPPELDPPPFAEPSAKTPEPTRVAVSDRPTTVVLEPSVSSTSITAADLTVTTSSHTGAWVTTGVAVAAAGVGGAFGGLGLSNRAKLANAPNGVSPLTYSQAQALQQTSNVQLTVALGAIIAAGVSGGVAAILWSAKE